MIDYTVVYRKSSLSMEVFRERYQDRDKFIGYYQDCPRYDTVWSCPPLQFDVDSEDSEGICEGGMSWATSTFTGRIACIGSTLCRIGDGGDDSWKRKASTGYWSWVPGF